MAFFRASLFAATSFPSRASLISLASAGVLLSKWTRRVHDFSISSEKGISGGNRISDRTVKSDLGDRAREWEFRSEQTRVLE